MLFLENMSDSIHSPAIRQPFSPDSIHSPAIRQPVSPDSIHSPDIRQPLSPDSIHSLTFAKGLFETFCDSPRHIHTSNSPFWRIWGEWPLLNKYAFNNVNWTCCSTFLFFLVKQKTLVQEGCWKLAFKKSESKYYLNISFYSIKTLPLKKMNEVTFFHFCPSSFHW